MSFLFKKMQIPSPTEALPGRSQPIMTPGRHFVLETPMAPPYPEHLELAMFGMGCFWGAEKKFWEVPGVYTTAVGYAAGHTPNPTYREVCSGMTGHNEVVQVVYDPAIVGYSEVVRIFWENHDPTQGMRQGNDSGTQYRSGIYTYSADQMTVSETSRAAFQQVLNKAGYGEITTEVLAAPEFYFAEEYHQQYLAKNPAGYCGLGGTGLSCPAGVESEISAHSDPD